MSNDLLDFLTDGLYGKQRDAVTQAFYEYASGDAQSAPVGMAVLLTACARRMSQAPEELRAVSADFRKLLAEGREMEARIRERVELSNAGVVAAFRDEAHRASSALRETFQYAKDAGESAKKTAQELRPVIVEVRKLADDVTLLRRDLKIHDESHRQMVECANTIEVSVQNVQQTVIHSTKESRANWITLGLMIGVFLSALFSQLPWWGALLAFTGIIGLLQWLSRQSWDFVRRWIENRKASSSQSKPAG
jgi:hypothetical protein